MKKIVISALAVLTLTSCGAPKIENPNDALTKNQKAVFQNIDTLVNIAPNEWNSKWNMNLSISAKEWDLKSDIKYDFNFREKWQETEWNLNILLDINVKDKNISPVEKISWSIDLDLIWLKNKVIFKLNELKINDIEKNPQLAMITWMVAPFQEKWYFIDLPENENLPFDQKLLIQNQEEIVKVLKKYNILEFVKENENENFYDYDVKISSENIVLASKEIYKLIQDDKELDEEEILNIKETIKEINTNIKSNIKIDKNNLELFTLTFNNEDWDLKIENKEKEFNFYFSENKEKIKINFNWKKLSKKLDSIIEATLEWEKLFNWKAIFEIDWKNTKINFDWIAKSEWEELKINFSMNDKTIKKSVKIEEPTDSTDFQEVIQSYMSTMMWISQ